MIKTEAMHIGSQKFCVYDTLETLTCFLKNVHRNYQKKIYN